MHMHGVLRGEALDNPKGKSEERKACPSMNSIGANPQWQGRQRNREIHDPLSAEWEKMSIIPTKPRDNR